MTANSLYGQTGAKTSSFYEKDVAASTTATGRKLLLYGKRVIEDVYNNRVCDTSQGKVKTYAEYVYRTIGIEGVLKLMEDAVNRRAYFETAVAIVYPPWEKVFKERVEGRISKAPRGTGGFGFDPIFIPYGQEKTFAEMGIEEKNQYSHRGRALHRLGKWITLIGKREKLR
jgi:non-canonical purine NTP pyrophosphatase (RdgB/HAM1 family)